MSDVITNEIIHVALGGMTMNERLYWFGLLDGYDKCSTEDDRLVIYAKLHAAK